ncbi:MAG: DUF3592 domain-containing protein, partial [Terracidiphilus sp.]
MPSHFKASFKVETRPLDDAQPTAAAQAGIESRAPNRPTGAALGGVVLVVCAISFLWYNIGFARYALTGFLWERTSGIVQDASRTSTPTIQFSTSDGVSHQFKEDYILLCGGRSTFCWIRDFNPGEVVPVVYDPGSPQTAFVYDWALFSGVISWILMASAG